MRAIYVPIADSFFESSIMQEELGTRFVMLSLIRLGLRADAGGVVDVDLRTFAGSINMPVEDVERAIVRLMEPDEHSASEAEEGRRIVPVNSDRPMRGWRMVNWPKYQHIVHLANDAARKRAERKASKEPVTDTSVNVPERPEASGGVPNRPLPSVNGATNTKNEERNTKNEKENISPRSTREDYPEDFESFWGFYPKSRRLGKLNAFKAWKHLTPEKRALAIAGATRLQAAYANATPDRLSFLVYPQGWLNGARWEDDPAEMERQSGANGEGKGPGVGPGAHAQGAEQLSQEQVRAFERETVGLCRDDRMVKFNERFGAWPVASDFSAWPAAAESKESGQNGAIVGPTAPAAPQGISTPHPPESAPPPLPGAVVVTEPILYAGNGIVGSVAESDVEPAPEGADDEL